MIDTLLVSVIIFIAALFVARRLYNLATTKNGACGCSGCGKADSCTEVQNTPNSSPCDSAR